MEIMCLCVVVWPLVCEGSWAHADIPQLVLLALANLLRLWVAALVIREGLRRQREGPNIDSQSRRSDSVRSFSLQLWCCTLFLISLLYLVTTVSAQDWRFAYSAAALLGINGMMGVPYCLSMDGGSDGPEIDMRTFQIDMIDMRTFRMPVNASTASTLQFDACCTICLVDLDEGQMVCQLPCGHAFHELCILRWLAVARCCPMRCALPAAGLASGVTDEVAAAAPRAAALSDGSEVEGRAGAIAVAGSGSSAFPENLLDVYLRRNAEAAVAAVNSGRRIRATRRPQRAAWHGTVRRVSELAVVGRSPVPVPEAIEDWAEEPVVAGLNGGAFDAVLSVPAPPPEFEPSVVHV